MYYIKFAKRINMVAMYEFYYYFNSKEALKKYEDKFYKYLYEEHNYFIVENGVAEFNDAGILIPN